MSLQQVDPVSVGAEIRTQRVEPVSAAHTMPSSRARSAAWTRSSTPSFVKMWVT